MAEISASQLPLRRFSDRAIVCEAFQTPKDQSEWRESYTLQPSPRRGRGRAQTRRAFFFSYSAGYARQRKSFIPPPPPQESSMLIHYRMTSERLIDTSSAMISKMPASRRSKTFGLASEPPAGHHVSKTFKPFACASGGPDCFEKSG